MNLKNVCSRKKIKMLMAVVVSVMTICLFFSEKVANANNYTEWQRIDQ